MESIRPQIPILQKEVVRDRQAVIDCIDSNHTSLQQVMIIAYSYVFSIHSYIKPDTVVKKRKERPSLYIVPPARTIHMKR